MPLDRFMIAPINSGLVTDIKPWLIPDDAFARLNNAYIFRGRLRKRFGSMPLNSSVTAAIAQLRTRLRINLGNTDINGDISTVVPGTIFAIGQMFSIGDQMFTVRALGAPAAMLISGSATSAFFNTTTGQVDITGADANTAVFFYPSEPVMGFITYETDEINNEPVFAFDTQFAYEYVSGGWRRLGTATWTGSNSQFFWGTTWQGVSDDQNYLYVSNFNAPDLIKYWDGATWTNLNPVFNVSGDTIETARLVIAFKNRLLLFNTIENISGTDTNFTNRVRFSQNGSPLQADAWREDIPGKGGFLDASTQEQITTAEFLKDRLIVFFEQSTWELVYTGDEVLPFRWQKINTELGAESTFSAVPFDKVILTVGDVGIHQCNGANVDRIDQKIPDEVFNIHNGNDGVFRVFGIRDYFLEMVYWTFPSSEDNPVFPNRVLVYNYKTGSWAFNDDSITAFGYFQLMDDTAWEDAAFTWGSSSMPWDYAGFQSQFKSIIAGNQQGYTFLLDGDLGRNSISLQITDVTINPGGFSLDLTVINHNLANGEYIIIENLIGSPSMEAALNGVVFTVNRVIDDNTINIIVQSGVVLGVYDGSGTIARVSTLDIWTKQYNFYVQDGRNAFIQKVDFLVDKTALGEVTVEAFPSSSEVPLAYDGSFTGALLGDAVLETRAYADVPLENSQTRVWHPVYLQAEGECLQLRIYLNDVQIRNTNIAWSDFQLNAMTFYTSPTSYRLQ